MAVTRLYFLFICGFLASVSCVRKLNSIDDLRNTGYGRPSPRHGLQILFWFVHNVEVDQNNNIIPSNFDPSRQDFGFHRFQNREGVLPFLSSGQSYYSVGNLNYPGSRALPGYVRTFYGNTREPERNMDRLIISLDRNRPNRISRVFITAHNRNRNDFNASDTYEIDTALISQIGEDHHCRNYVYPSTDTTYYAEDARCGHFLLRLLYNTNVCRRSQLRKRSTVHQCDINERIKLQIKATKKGHARLVWVNVPDAKNYKYVYIDICQNMNSDEVQVKKQVRIYTSYGSLDTSVSLNAGLQPRVRLYTSYFSKPHMWYGPEFDGANGVIPQRIKGTDASLQLYVKGGKACARLYIKKTFSNWKDVFHSSWVGFYKSSRDTNEDYYTYQYVKGFVKTDTSENYNIFQSMCSLAIAPAVQVRLLYKHYRNVLAQTTPWEGDEQWKHFCDIWPKLTPPWSDPDFYNEPEFSDANNVLPIKILNYDAGLQLFTKDLKACARLYIKKTFTDWKHIFHNSWVGFYTSPQDKNYHTFQYAVKFAKTDGGSKNFDVYQYRSKLDMTPGVQIRFMGHKRYNEKLAETKPWTSS